MISYTHVYLQYSANVVDICSCQYVKWAYLSVWNIFMKMDGQWKSYFQMMFSYEICLIADFGQFSFLFRNLHNKAITMSKNLYRHWTLEWIIHIRWNNGLNICFYLKVWNCYGMRKDTIDFVWSVFINQWIRYYISLWTTLTSIWNLSIWDNLPVSFR